MPDLMKVRSIELLTQIVSISITTDNGAKTIFAPHPSTNDTSPIRRLARRLADSQSATATSWEYGLIFEVAQLVARSTIPALQAIIIHGPVDASDRWWREHESSKDWINHVLYGFIPHLHDEERRASDLLQNAYTGWWMAQAQRMLAFLEHDYV